ncbi:MAG: hypothetical protein R3C15_11990 [Thermoleophilia bacterium]
MAAVAGAARIAAGRALDRDALGVHGLHAGEDAESASSSAIRSMAGRLPPARTSREAHLSVPRARSGAVGGGGAGSGAGAGSARAAVPARRRGRRGAGGCGWDDGGGGAGAGVVSGSGAGGGGSGVVFVVFVVFVVLVVSVSVLSVVSVSPRVDVSPWKAYCPSQGLKLTSCFGLGHCRRARRAGPRA